MAHYTPFTQRSRDRDFKHGTIPGQNQLKIPEYPWLLAGSRPFTRMHDVGQPVFNPPLYPSWIAGSADPCYFFGTHSHLGPTQVNLAIRLFYQCERGFNKSWLTGHSNYSLQTLNCTIKIKAEHSLDAIGKRARQENQKRITFWAQTIKV